MHGVGLWKGVQLCKEFFDELISFKIGKGSRINFWEDRWVENMKLKDAFYGLYEVSRKKKCMVN